MAQQDKTTFEGTFNNSSTGLFKTNTTKDIGSDDLRTLVDNLTDSVPFNQDDRYTWSFPQVSTTGTNTYAATPSPAITAYSTGQAFKIKFTEASSGASTLNLNGLGAKKLYINPTTQAGSGNIVDEQVYFLVYDAALDAATGGFLIVGYAAATDVSGKQNIVNAATALTDASSMDLTAIKHTLTTSSATRTFTISYTGDDISIRVVLNTTSSVFTFPAGALCVNSDGSASGDNTCSLAGTSGDVYVFAIKHWGSSVYTVVCKNTLQ